MKRIVILDDYQNVALSRAPWDRLTGRAEVTACNRHVHDPSALLQLIGDANVLVVNRERTPVTAELLANLPALELIVTLGMRNASVDIAAAAARNITVCGTATLGTPTAELTWGLILSLMRHIPEETAALRRGEWQSGPLGIGLDDKTLGIAGFGRIGQRVAAIGKAFGMSVIAWSRSLDSEGASAAGVTAVGKDALWRDSDIVSIHLPLNTQTRGSVGEEELARMKATAILVNTARAGIVDNAALVAALHAGGIAGAALDVFDEEPLPEGSPLRAAPNLLLTPHLGYVTEENYLLAYGQAAENIAAWLDGAPVRVLQPLEAPR